MSGQSDLAIFPSLDLLSKSTSSVLPLFSLQNSACRRPHISSSISTREFFTFSGTWSGIPAAGVPLLRE